MSYRPAIFLSASGLTGAVSASRYVGATASVAPVTGTFVVGDFVITQTGRIFICTVGGSPGTWVDVGSVDNLVTSVFGRTGAVVLLASDVQGVKGVVYSPTSQVANYNALNGDVVVANGTFTVTLPAVSAGATVIVKNIGTGAVLISPASGTIDGAASLSTSVQYQSYTLVSDGVNWFVV